MALPHFTNITSHNQNWEPVYKNLFEVEIFLPDVIRDRHPNATELLLENITTANLPTYPTIPAIDQRFKYSTRVYLGFPDRTSTSLSLNFNINQNDSKQMFTFRMMKDWYDLVWNNEDGSSNYKRNILGEIILYQHDREGEIIRRVTYHNCQLSNFTPETDLSWDNTSAIMGMSSEFQVDWWEDYYF